MMVKLCLGDKHQIEMIFVHVTKFFTKMSKTAACAHSRLPKAVNDAGLFGYKLLTMTRSKKINVEILMCSNVSNLAIGGVRSYWM